MNIFSFLVMLYSFEVGIIPEQGSTPLYENQSKMSCYADFGVKFVLLNKFSISGNIENNFIYNPNKENRNYFQFSPFLDIYTFSVTYSLNKNVSFFLKHYCKHKVYSDALSSIEIYENRQAKTKVGFKFSNM